MTARRASLITTRTGTLLATVALATAGIALTAAPASAGEPDGDCPAATQPPSPNTWYGSDGSLRGAQVSKRINYPTDRVVTESVVTYQTYYPDSLRVETWSEPRVGPPTRLECTEYETPETEAPRGGGSSSSGAYIGGGGTLWMTSLGGGDQEEVRYGTIREVKQI